VAEHVAVIQVVAAVTVLAFMLTGHNVAPIVVGSECIAARTIPVASARTKAIILLSAISEI